MRPPGIAFGAVSALAAVLAVGAVEFAAGGSSPAHAQQAPSRDIEAVVKDYFATFPNEARRFVKDYLVQHPDVLREAVAENKLRADRTALINSNAFALFNSSKRVPLGNPNGDVILAEFTDYNCGPCRRMLSVMLGLIKSDPNLKVVVMQNPVLGAGSVEAAKVAIAVQMQDGGGAKYLDFHSKLLAGPGPANKLRALAVAAELGLDVARLEADQARPEVDAILEEGRKLARDIGIRGTPGYVVCDRILPGAVPAGTMANTIRAARQAQQDSGTRCEVRA